MQPPMLVRFEVHDRVRPAGRAERAPRRSRFLSGALVPLLATGVMAGAGFGAAPAVAASNLCVAANGAVRAQKGTATCAADGTGSMAIAKGDVSSATATRGDHNKARALADSSSAVAGLGDNNIATASGVGSTASAVNGDSNIATAA